MESTLLENKKEIGARDEDIRRMQAMLSSLGDQHLESANRKLTLEDELRHTESLRHLSRYEYWYRLGHEIR